MILAALGAAPTPAGELAQRIDRLSSPVRVLYVAAHPDDENTQMLTWLARGEKVRAAYLSLTRGDGGQNLIGAEQRPLLGVIRTHELLAARDLDGAEQWFTRLRDFGYSKSAEETLARWGEETALGEVVRVFRSFRPHVVITRFPETGSTHGHHLASARLARRATEAAKDPDAFPEQLGEGGLSPWAVDRLFYNFPEFWARRRGWEPPPGRLFRVDVGGYDPWRGESFGEISGRSRSMHKSQGFGATARHGPFMETLVLLEGEVPKGDDPFAGLPAWSDLEGGSALTEAVDAAGEALRGSAPAKALPYLARAHAAAERLPQPARSDVRAELEQLLVAGAGLFLEARSEVAEVAPGGEVKVELRALVRNPDSQVVLRKVTTQGAAITPREVLRHHTPWTEEITSGVASDAEPSRPHWLRVEPTPFLYPVDERGLALRPALPGPVRVAFELGIAGVGLTVEREVRHHWRDPVLGERTQPVEVAPPLSVTPSETVLLAPNGEGRLGLTIRAGEAAWRGLVALVGPVRAQPETVAVDLEPGASSQVELQIAGDETAEVSVEILAEGESARAEAWTRTVVDHDHIPVVTVRRPATFRFVPVELERPRRVVGYVGGSGDRVADILGRLGLDVRPLDAAALAHGDFSELDVILTGIRAYNVNEALVAAQDRILQWVKSGGSLVVQYNTRNWSSALEVSIGPYPIEFGRGRVTDETAEVEILAPEHPVLTGPNRIRPEDFSGWVQERGLYFAESWDERYAPLFSMRDPGEEEAQRGSTLVARYGEGTFVFSGLSFFRQLPAGNPGASRLLVNLLSFGAQEDR